MNDNHSIHQGNEKEHIMSGLTYSNLFAHSAPLVSICIPTYNGACYIKETLSSCLKQTYPLKEIIIADDGSTDGCREIIQEFANQHDNIHVFYNEINLGLVGNWKRCVELAKGDWIKFIFQDDIMMEDCVEKMMSTCMNHQTRMAICARAFIFENNADKKIRAYYTNELSRAEKLFTGKIKFEPEETGMLLPSFVIENVLGEPICTLFHRSLYDEIGGFNATFRQMVDYEFSMKAVLSAPFCMISEKLVHFRVHGASTTGTTHAGSSQKNQVSEKIIQSSVGDLFRLIATYRSKQLFHFFTSFWGEERLYLLERFLLLRACKDWGEKKVKAALADIMSHNNHLKDYHYNWFRYKWIKQRYKKEIRPFMNKYGGINSPGL